MISHTVLFKVKSSVSKEAIDLAFRHLFKLKDSLPGILNIIAGKCHFHEGKGADFLTHGFSIDFENEEAYATFMDDPVTYSAKTCIINIAIDGYERIFGFDIGKSSYAFPNPLDKYRIPIPRLLPRGFK